MFARTLPLYPVTKHFPHNSHLSEFVLSIACLFVVCVIPGLSPPSYSFASAPPVLTAEAAAALYPPIGQVLLAPRPLPPGHGYYPASAQLYMNYSAYYPRYGAATKNNTVLFLHIYLFFLYSILCWWDMWVT